jgi:hypothetical protein
LDVVKAFDTRLQACCPKLLVFPGENHVVIYCQTFLHTHTSWHAGCVAQGGLQSEDMPTQEELPIKNGVLFYKQLIRPMTDYSYPTCKSSACTHVQELQVLQSKCHHGATNAPCCVSNRQTHEDLGIPFFAD